MDGKHRAFPQWPAFFEVAGITADEYRIDGHVCPQGDDGAAAFERIGPQRVAPGAGAFRKQ